MTKSLLTEKLLLALSKTVDITQVPPDHFSVHLGLTSAAGNAWKVNANMAGNSQGAIFDLLKAYIDKHGTKPPIARQLLEIFKTNAMMTSAEHLEEAMIEQGVELEKKPQTVITSDHCTCSADSTAGLTTKGGDKKELTDSFITDLAKSIGNPSNLLDLGLKLGFQESLVNIYRQTNQRNEDWSGTTKMLFTWKRKTSKKDQIPQLKTTLTESGFAELADQL